MARGKLTRCEAKAMLEREGINFATQDYFDLSGYETGLLNQAAKRAGYRNRTQSGKSTGRAFFDLLRRTGKCR